MRKPTIKPKPRLRLKRQTESYVVKNIVRVYFDGVDNPPVICTPKDFIVYYLQTPSARKPLINTFGHYQLLHNLVKCPMLMEYENRYEFKAIVHFIDIQNKKVPGDYMLTIEQAKVEGEDDIKIVNGRIFAVTYAKVLKQ